MFQRVIRGAAADARLVLDAAPTAVTVTITRASGVALVTDGNATETATGATFPLSAANLADVDLLAAVWTADGETHRTFVEVVGGFLISLGELATVDGLEDVPDDDLERGRLVAETALEDAARVAFVPRYRRVQLDGNGMADLLLPMPEVRRVRRAVVDDVELTADELAELVVYDEGAVYRPDCWAKGRRNVVLDVEHGYEVPPPRVAEAAKPLARHALVETAVDERTISTTNENGVVQVFVQPGMRGAVFAYPEANAVVQQYGYRGVR